MASSFTEKHPAGADPRHRSHLQPDGADARSSGRTARRSFALTEELVLHLCGPHLWQRDDVQEKCLFRVTRNADIDVKEGMMDHDIDYREIMTELLKRRRKLAAVRLQIIAGRAGGRTPAVQPSASSPINGCSSRKARWI